MKLSFVQLIRSKTVWAGIFSAGALLIKAEPITPDIVLQALGFVLGAVGVKDAITKRS